jgi:molybdate transport system ATP-binding protein
MKQISLHIENLRVKQHGNVVLDGISFDLLPNQHLAITGASGSGKTTLAKAIAGQLFHEGSVIVKDSKSDKTPFVFFVEHRNEFKNLSNQSNFYYQQRYNSTESEDSLTVIEELNTYFRKVFPKQEHNDNISFWLLRIGLYHRNNTPLIQLSNGEHKRLQLVKALMLQPDVLVMDQPFTGLDVQSRELVSELFDEISKHALLIMISGHEQLPLCITHILELKNGNLKQFCSKGQCKKQQEDKKIAFSFAGTLPFILENSLEFSSAVYMSNVSVRYNEKIIFEKVNWNVQKSDKWQVKGANGSGKSTLLSLINGDNPQAYANEIYLFDRRRGTGESIWDIKQKIGYVSPEMHWYFDKSISVFETIASGFFDTMGLYRKLSEQQETLIAKWFAVFDLSEQAFTLLSHLSVSKQRLVMLIRALIKNPSLLILDEPCQGLDDQQTADFIYLIDHFCHDKTLIYVSHYDHEVPSCINKKLELKNGKAAVTIIDNTHKAVA